MTGEAESFRGFRARSSSLRARGASAGLPADSPRGVRPEPRLARPFPSLFAPSPERLRIITTGGRPFTASPRNEPVGEVVIPRVAVPAQFALHKLTELRTRLECHTIFHSFNK